MQRRIKLNKKGSISISINMIVVVVLAFVMLGLLLGLGRQIIGQSQDTAISVIGQTKQDIQNELIRNDDPLYFSQREYNVGFGKKATLNFGVKNVNPSDGHFYVDVTYLAVDENTGETTPTPLNPSRKGNSEAGKLTGGSFFWASVPQKIGAGEGSVFDVQYQAPKSQNTYLFKFVLRETVSETGLKAATDRIVAEQIIFINVS
jgi:hypothetical protein